MKREPWIPKRPIEEFNGSSHVSFQSNDMVFKKLTIHPNKCYMLLGQQGAYNTCLDEFQNCYGSAIMWLIFFIVNKNVLSTPTIVY